MVPRDVEDVLASLGARYLEEVLSGRREDACQLLLTAVEQDDLHVRDVYRRVLAPAQRELGRLWEARKISVAEEHLATATTQLAMARLFSQAPRKRPTLGVLVAACVEGDLHEVGLRMVADLFELSGWETHYLGANTPVWGLFELLRLRNADALAVSAVMPEYLPAVRAMIGSVREREEFAAVRIIVGGRAFDKDPEMAEWVGAHHYARSPEAAMSWLVNEDLEVANDVVPEVRVEPPRNNENLPRFDDLMRLNNELVTLQRRLAQESAALAEHARRAKLYLGTAVHDLRGSIGAVRGISRQLAADLADTLSAEQNEAFEVIDNAAGYMLSVVEEGLRAARSGHETMALDRTRVELAPIVRGCLQRAAFAADKANVQLEIRCPPEPLRASVDVRRFEQIIDNLVANAIRFAPHGSTVRVRLELVDGEIMIRVEDDGPGVPDEDRTRLFRTYDLVPSGERGTGFGLAIVRHLTVAHGGGVRVESSDSGGAAFIVELPAA